MTGCYRLLHWSQVSMHALLSCKTFQRISDMLGYSAIGGTHRYEKLKMDDNILMFTGFCSQPIPAESFIILIITMN